MATTPTQYTVTSGLTQVTLQLPTSGSAQFKPTDGAATQTLVVGKSGGPSQSTTFTLVNTDGAEYMEAFVTVEYTSTSTVISPSYCHVYFKPGGTNWYWAGNPNVPGDNTTVFVDGAKDHLRLTIAFQVPTQPNPAQSPSVWPALDSTVVYLLDQNANGNLLFRGNEPLTSGEKNQSVDFLGLHNLLAKRYQQQTGKNDFPAIGSYVLRDIAFLNANPNDEGPILLSELQSFGGTNLSQLNGEVWFPATPALMGPGIPAQMMNANIQPSGGSPTHPNLTYLQKFVANLSIWMNTQVLPPVGPQPPLPYVYYIHCSSGHDRTGMAAAGYLMVNRGLGLSDSFIYGTTIHKMNGESSGNLVRDCVDVTSGAVDPDRSRCFVAGNADATDSPYNDTIVALYNLINSTSDTLSASAISGDPALGNKGTVYVHSTYPWSS